MSLCDVGCPSGFTSKNVFLTFTFLCISGCCMPSWVGEAMRDTMLPSILVFLLFGWIITRLFWTCFVFHHGTKTPEWKISTANCKPSGLLQVVFRFGHHIMDKQKRCYWPKVMTHSELPMQFIYIHCGKNWKWAEMSCETVWKQQMPPSRG